MLPKVKCVLVPIDFSDDSTRALKAGLFICKTQEAKLLVMHAVEPFNYPPYYGFVPDPPDQVLESAEAHIKEFFEAIPASDRGGVDSEILVEIGKPSSAIIDCVEEKDVDLIVIGSHGRSAFQRFLVGSTAERVMKNAACSVLVVRGDSEGDDKD